MPMIHQIAEGYYEFRTDDVDAPPASPEVLRELVKDYQDFANQHLAEFRSCQASAKLPAPKTVAINSLG